MAKVLIIEDSQSQLYYMSKLMEEHGHQVTAADTGEEGMTKAEKQQPDVILMDIVMPGINGLQAARKLSKNEPTKSIPVIFVTTKDGETDRIWGMRQGAAAYITKPIDEEALLQAISEATA